MIAAKRTLHVYIACTLLSGFCCSAPTCVHSNMHRSVIHRGDLCAHSMQTSKVALLFLTRGELPLEPLWRRWFEDIDGLVYRGCRPDAAKAPEDCQTHLQHTTSGLTCGGPIASQHLFNVYVHPAMGLDHFQENSIFYGYEISQRAETRWDFSSAAIYTLFHAAVHNLNNAFFVVLSEACAPLYPAPVVYLEIINLAKSRMNPGCRGAPDFGNHWPNEYQPDKSERDLRRLFEEMEPLRWSWAKTSTWVVLNRKHAKIVSDYPQDGLLRMTDEYFLATLLHTLGLENETTCDWQGPTFTSWRTGSSHPLAFAEINSTIFESARLGSAYHEVGCQWSAALASAGGQFGKVDQAAWGVVFPYPEMADTCPLFIRKVHRTAVPDLVSLLWPSISSH